jgi:hypothetical protein
VRRSADRNAPPRRHFSAGGVRGDEGCHSPQRRRIFSITSPCRG